MEKSIYAISGYIPSDENIVVINLYKLIKYGRDEIRYAWVMINGTESNGIGTGTNEFGEKEKEDALIQITRYRDKNFCIFKCTFDEVIIHYQDLKEVLQSELDEILKNKTNDN